MLSYTHPYPDVHISPQPGSGQDLDFKPAELCIDKEMVRHLFRVAVHT
jgi:hypothetical protein